MKLYELLTKETWEKFGDMDVSNDCIDELAPAWCGTTLTEEGKKQFASVLNLEAEIRPVWGYDGISVNIDHLPNYEEVWEEVLDLFNSMAGYINEEEHNEWFKEE